MNEIVEYAATGNPVDFEQRKKVTLSQLLTRKYDWKCWVVDSLLHTDKERGSPRFGDNTDYIINFIDQVVIIMVVTLTLNISI